MRNDNLTKIIVISSLVFLFGVLGFVQAHADTLICNLPRLDGTEAVFQGHIMVLDNDNKSFTFKTDSGNVVLANTNICILIRPANSGE